MDHEAKGFRCTLPKRLTLLNGSHSFFFLIFFPSVNLMHCIFVSALLAFFFVSFIVIFFGFILSFSLFTTCFVLSVCLVVFSSFSYRSTNHYTPPLWQRATAAHRHTAQFPTHSF
ncbi:hypothetical protein J3E74DRAFT_359740, partial [Bipolaris maydis]